jgi:DNA-binding transcriptional MerR regulator
MNGKQAQLSIDELAEQCGIPTRTIRYYITTRLIAGPAGRGKQAHYNKDHLLRLQLIRRLTALHLPLDEIAARLDGLSTADVQALLADEEGRSAALAQAAHEPSPKAYVESLLRRMAPVDRRPADPALPASRPTSQALGSSPAASIAAPSGSRPGTDERREAASAPTPDVPGSTWKRWELAPGLELHVLSGAEAGYQRIIDRLRRLAADALERRR